MNREVIITCALTGAGDTVGRNPHVPVTPAQIAEDALAAAAAGAAIVHVHVRDPQTGAPSRDTQLFAEVHERIRAVNRELILNYTGGMGGDLWFDLKGGARIAENSDFVGAAERVQHVLDLRPDIGSLDCGSLNFGEMVYATTPNLLREILRLYNGVGVSRGDRSLRTRPYRDRQAPDRRGSDRAATTVSALPGRPSRRAGDKRGDAGNAQRTAP
jgi:uncharacterized protein (DUF849 family)